jgi:hypothetical protein
MKLQQCLANKVILKLGHTTESENQADGMYIPGNQRISLQASILSTMKGLSVCIIYGAGLIPAQRLAIITCCCFSAVELIR